MFHNDFHEKYKSTLEEFEKNCPKLQEIRKANEEYLEKYKDIFNEFNSEELDD